MKKLLLPFLFLSITSIQAGQPLHLNPQHVVRCSRMEPVLTDSKVYSQAYEWQLLDNAVSIYGPGDRWFCDDFCLDEDYYITDIYTWVIWTGVHASHMNLVISEDDLNDSDPNTNTDVWAESVPCTSTPTGDSQWGYDFYEVHCVISTDVYPELSKDTHYYFEYQSPSPDNTFALFSYICVEDCAWHDVGSGVWVSMDTWWSPSDAFFVLLGEQFTAIEPETWGSIKTLF